jgi:DNA polymerase-3 subunit delta'
VVLFYRMDLMRQASADALLKLIEEPPRETVIILTAAQPDALLPTILSRARKVRLKRPPEKLVVEYLRENYQATETAAKLATRVSQRSLGRALGMIGGEDAAGADRRAIGLLLFKGLMSESAPSLVAQMGEVLNFRDRGAAVDLIHLWQSLVRDGAYLAGTGDTTDIVNVDFQSELEAIAPRLANPAVVQAIVATTKNTLADLRLNVHIQPALVAMALKLKMDMETGDTSAGSN